MYNLIKLKTLLSKYYSEVFYSTTQEKYKNTGFDKLFEQRFQSQNNIAQMVVDPLMTGLSITISGNKFWISKELHNHPNVIINNSIENQSTESVNLVDLYNPATIQTLAYLICQNHITLRVIGDLEEPLYIKYKSDFETFYNSVITFEINNETDVEIVEEIESNCALNVVTNYILHEFSKLNLSTFYQNNIASLSCIYRNIFVREDARYVHNLLGLGSVNVVDENKITCESGSTAELYGIINSNKREFHSILSTESATQDYDLSVVYKNILLNNPLVTFYTPVKQTTNNREFIEILNLNLDNLSENTKEIEIEEYLHDIVDRILLERMLGTKRFYDNKKRFLDRLN